MMLASIQPDSKNICVENEVLAGIIRQEGRSFFIKRDSYCSAWRHGPLPGIMADCRTSVERLMERAVRRFVAA